jgi:hypothetical protein
VSEAVLEEPLAAVRGVVVARVQEERERAAGAVREGEEEAGQRG